MTKRPPTTETRIVLRTILSAGVLAVLLLACAGTAAGATWVVDDDGGAGVDYTTIQAAVDAASAGDTVEVRSGTYVENVYANKQLTLRGIDTGEGMPVVDADGSWRAISVTTNAHGCTIDGFKVTGSKRSGIVIHSNNNVIKNNVISNNGYGVASLSSFPGADGICLMESFNTTLLNNDIFSNNRHGICVFESSYTMISGNNVHSNNKTGIYVNRWYNWNLHEPSGNNITDNNVYQNNDRGIWLHLSYNNMLQNNSMNDNEKNFEVSGCLDCSQCKEHFIQNIDTSNMIDGKLLYYLVNEQDRVIDSSSNAGYVGIVNSDNITVRDLTLKNNGQGVLFAFTSNSKIENINAANNNYGIELVHSDNNELMNNVLSNNTYGISVLISGSNILKSNMMVNNAMNFNVYGGWTPRYSAFIQDMDTSNTVNGKPIYYLVNEQDQMLDSTSNAGYVGIVDSNNVTVRDLTLANNGQGILFAFTDHSKIENVNASNNDCGIELASSNDNDLLNNELSKSNDGVLLRRSTNNVISSVNIHSNLKGIHLLHSDENTLTSNNVYLNNNSGIYLEYSCRNNLTNNSIHSNKGEYGFGIFLIGNCNNNIISSNNISSNNDYGIYSFWSSNNKISNNRIFNNKGGIRLFGSLNNNIYINNFVNNNRNGYSDDSINTWNSTSPITYNYNSKVYTNYLGNHWDDYTGTDSDGDGIGDTPYPIPGGSSVDRYPLMAPYTPHTGPQDRSLVQVEGQPEVYWFQNNRRYWVTDWNVINDMSGVPGWDSVNTLPASEFDPATYSQGPRFITTGAESNDLLIREQGDIKVYLILNGEKHHFTSPEALTWNGYGFDDVIEVSSTIVGMFPEGTPISIQEKHLLRKPGGTHVFWSQNGELYYVTADALDKMLDIYGWGWDEINEPADFNPEDPSHYKTFITTDPESNGVLIRLWDGYKVYRIEDGFRRHITYPDVMELKGYAMEDVIDVSQDVISMFPLGDPLGIEVNLTFNKTIDPGEEPCTKFTTGETVKFYTETTVSEGYTVDTYVKLTEPDGRTRYAYHTDPDFQPTDQLSFSDTEVPLYPGHWDAVSKNWNWHEYTFNDDEEGVYTWEFYYRDVISGKVLGWDRKSYVFAKKTDLGLELTISTNKEVYRENEPIIIFADVHDSNGNDVVVNKNDFEVYLDNFPQEFELEQVCSIHGNYEIIGLKAPGPSVIGHKIDVSVKTGAGNAFDTETIRVGGGYETYKVLMILASPYDIMDRSPSKDRPSIEWDGADWYETHGSPEWYRDVADEISDYYWRISYEKVNLEITTTDKWLRLPKSDSEYGSRNEFRIFSKYDKDAKKAATNYNSKYNENNYDFVITVDPTSPGDDRYARGVVGGITIYRGIYSIVLVGTPYIVKSNSDLTMVRITAHEISHWIDKKNDEPLHLGKIVQWQGDCLNSYHSIMGPMSERTYNIPGYLAPFDPSNAKKMDFSTYSEISVPSLQTLIPIESGKDRTIHFSEKVHNFNPLKGALQWHTIHYFIEFRDNSWPSQPQKPEFEKPAVILWKSDTKWRSDPREDPHRWDHPDVVGGRGMNYPALYMDNIGNKKLSIRLKEISNSKAVLDIRYSTDVFVITNKTSEMQYNIKMYLIGNFFEDFPYNFSVIDTTDQSEVFNSTLTTNSNGEFDTSITFNDTLTDNIETHPYLIRVHTVSGWVPFLIATPSLIDGISSETPTFTTSDPAETNTAGDLTNLTSTCGSMKLSLKTAVPVDTSSYRYVIYLDSDNSSSTGSIVNSIGADYKIEYSDTGAGLYKYNTSWTLVDTPYLNASHNGTNIEILTTTEIMNATDTVKLVAQTFDSSDILHDTLPDPTATPPYLEFMDVHPMDLRFAEYGYYAGDNVTVNGYGFAQNQMIPITIMNQTGHVLWNGNVQADSDGQVINVSTYAVPDDFYGTAYLYWAGAQMDSFSRLMPPLPVYNAEFELDAPTVAGVGREFNVTVSFENIGDDLTNLTLNLNTSGMTSEPETIWIGDLTSGQNYTYTWNLTPTGSGFALLKAEVCSNQSTFVTDQKGIYIANVSAEIDAPNDTQCGSAVEFNVSVTNNQENITYTDLGINTSIKEIETNFTQQVIALPPGHTVNQSYLWDTANVTPGTYQIMVDIVSNGVVLSSGESSILVNFTPVDTTPPSPITHLHPTLAPTYINWTWTNPPDPDFNHTEIYLNGAFQTITPAEHYNATDLTPETSYTISTHTVDTAGNINQTWVNDTATTLKVYNITFLPPITTPDHFNLTNGRTLPIKFTARDNDTGEFIYDDTVNVTITNSTGHLIAFFTNGTGTDSVRINSTEEQYIVNFHTKDYDLNVGETYTIHVTFGEAGAMRGYVITHFTLVDRKH